MDYGTKKQIKDYIEKRIDERQQKIKNQAQKLNNKIATEIAEQILPDALVTYNETIKQAYADLTTIIDQHQQLHQATQSEKLKEISKTSHNNQLHPLRDALGYIVKGTTIGQPPIISKNNIYVSDQLVNAYNAKQMDATTVHKAQELADRHKDNDRLQNWLERIINRSKSSKEACLYIESLNINLNGYYEYVRQQDDSTVDYLPEERTIDNRFIPL